MSSVGQEALRSRNAELKTMRNTDMKLKHQCKGENINKLIDVIKEAKQKIPVTWVCFQNFQD